MRALEFDRPIVAVKHRGDLECEHPTVNALVYIPAAMRYVREPNSLGLLHAFPFIFSSEDPIKTRVGCGRGNFSVARATLVRRGAVSLIYTSKPTDLA